MWALIDSADGTLARKPRVTILDDETIWMKRLIEISIIQSYVSFFSPFPV